MSLVTINHLPQEALINIFSHLSPQDLTKRIALVCKLWNPLSEDASLWKQFDIKEIFPKIKVIDATTYKKIFKVDVKNESPAKGLTYENAKKVGTLKVENNRGLTLLTLAEEVKAENLSSTVSFRNLGVDPEVWNQLKGSCVEKTHRVIITNLFLTESLGKSPLEQIKMMEEHGCEMSSFIAHFAHIALTNFGDTPGLGSRDSIRCMSDLKDRYPIIEISSRGQVTLTSDYYADEEDQKKIGAGAMMKL